MKKKNMLEIPTEVKTLALKGNPEMQFKLATIYEHNGRSCYLYWYTKAAEQGHAEAQYRLSNLLGCLWSGDVESFDIAVVADLLMKAAEQGHAEAQVDLGFYYSYKHDNVLALEWWRKSAEQGNASAQCAIGDCYENGDGVDKDIAIAIEWYKKAAVQGYYDAQEALDQLMNK